MYTEDEAREKWCPHARQTDSEGVPAHNSFYSDSSGEVSQETNCIGSACMAWRDAGEKPGDKQKADNAYRKTGHFVPPRKVGYCGLSGSPYMGGE